MHWFMFVYFFIGFLVGYATLWDEEPGTCDNKHFLKTMATFILIGFPMLIVALGSIAWDIWRSGRPARESSNG